jgi:hypothetical protein
VGHASRRRPRATRTPRQGGRLMPLLDRRGAAACAASHRWRMGRRPTPERGALAGKVSCPDPEPEAEISAPCAPETSSQVCRRHAGRLCTGDVRAPWRIHTRRGSGADRGAWPPPSPRTARPRRGRGRRSRARPGGCVRTLWARHRGGTPPLTTRARAQDHVPPGVAWSQRLSEKPSLVV